MSKLSKGYCDNRTPEQALANTQKAWLEEDRFFKAVIEPLGGVYYGTDKDRIVGVFSTNPDFLINNIFIEYQCTFKDIKQLSFKRHKILNFTKYPYYLIVQRIQDKYIIIDSDLNFTPAKLYWCGGKDGYILDSSRFSSIIRLTEKELHHELQKRTQIQETQT